MELRRKKLVFRGVTEDSASTLTDDCEVVVIQVHEAAEILFFNRRLNGEGHHDLITVHWDSRNCRQLQHSVLLVDDDDLTWVYSKLKENKYHRLQNLIRDFDEKIKSRIIFVSRDPFRIGVTHDTDCDWKDFQKHYESGVLKKLLVKLIPNSIERNNTENFKFLNLNREEYENWYINEHDQERNNDPEHEQYSQQNPTRDEANEEGQQQNPHSEECRALEDSEETHHHGQGTEDPKIDLILAFDEKAGKCQVEQKERTKARNQAVLDDVTSWRKVFPHDDRKNSGHIITAGEDTSRTKTRPTKQVTSHQDNNSDKETTSTYEETFNQQQPDQSAIQDYQQTALSYNRTRLTDCTQPSRRAGMYTVLILNTTMRLGQQCLQEQKTIATYIVTGIKELAMKDPELEENFDVVVFGEGAKMLLQATHDYEAILDTIGGLSCGGETPLQDALELCRASLDKIGVDNVLSRYIIFTDGSLGHEMLTNKKYWKPLAKISEGKLVDGRNEQKLKELCSDQRTQNALKRIKLKQGSHEEHTSSLIAVFEDVEIDRQDGYGSLDVAENEKIKNTETEGLPSLGSRVPMAHSTHSEGLGTFSQRSNNTEGSFSPEAKKGSWVWQWEDCGNKWHRYNHDVNVKLEKEFLASRRSCVIKMEGTSYRIMLKDKVEINVTNKGKRKVKRLYVED